MDDGSIVQGKLTFTVAGATATDIPQLKLAVIANQRTGALASATLVYWVKTHGGMLEGPRPTLGAFRAVSYSADYLFEK